MVDPVLVAKAAATLLTNEKARKGVGWAIAAILSPIIVVIALLCALGSGAVSHNISAAQLCFQDGPLPADTPAEYRVCIEQTRASFAELDTVIADIQSNMEDGNSLDPIRVKAVFFSLYFGGEAPSLAQFAHCFASSETRTETVTEQDEEGSDIEVERVYNVFVPIADMATVYSRIAASLGAAATEEQKTNADNVYSLIKYAVLICNEVGKLIGLPANRRVGGDTIAGTFLIAGSVDGEFCSLSAEDAAHYAVRYAEPMPFYGSPDEPT